MPRASWRSRCKLIGQENNEVISRALPLKEAKVGHYYSVLRCLYEQYRVQYYKLDDFYIIVVNAKVDVRHDLKLEIQTLHYGDGSVNKEILEATWRDANKLLLPLSEKEIIDFGNRAAINAMGKVESFINQFPKPRTRKSRKQ